MRSTFAFNFYFYFYVTNLCLICIFEEQLSIAYSMRLHTEVDRWVKFWKAGGGLGSLKKQPVLAFPYQKNALESCSRGLKQDHRHRTATEIKSVGKGCFHRLLRPINPLLLKRRLKRRAKRSFKGGHDLGSPVWLRSENNLFKPMDPTNWWYSSGLLYSFFTLVLYHDTSARTLSGFYHYQPIQIGLVTFTFGMGKPLFLTTWWLLALYRKPVFFFFFWGGGSLRPWTDTYLSFYSASDFFMFRCGWELPSWACSSAVNGWVCTCASMHPLSAHFLCGFFPIHPQPSIADDSLELWFILWMQIGDGLATNNDHIIHSTLI